MIITIALMTIANDAQKKKKPSNIGGCVITVKISSSASFTCQYADLRSRDK